MNLENTINQSHFDFAFVIKELMKKGWDLGQLSYGEERLGIGPSLELVKDGVSKVCYSVSDVESILQKEFERKI